MERPMGTPLLKMPSRAAAATPPSLLLVLSIMAGGGYNRSLAVVEAATLPTTLPIKHTTRIDYDTMGYDGTIPTEFGLLTKLTWLSLYALIRDPNRARQARPASGWWLE